MPTGHYIRTPDNTGCNRKQPRPIIIPIGPSIAYVPLTQGLYALISREDAQLVGSYRWSVMRIKKVIYAVSHVTPGFKQPVKLVMMHALILGKDPDHRNHNTLDNRRENLRKATRAQQGWNRRISKANTTGYKGVCRRNIGDRNWQTTITANGKRIHLGYFYTPEEAAEVYRNAALKLHGEFACFF